MRAMTRNKRSKQLFGEPKALWQRVIAGERLPTRLLRHPKCEGTVEDHRGIALDVRELIRQGVFDRPVGSVFKLNLAYPWLRVMRLNSFSLELQLVTGRIVVVPLGLGKLWRHGRAITTRVPVVWPAHLHDLLPRWESRMSALQWPPVCRTAHQQRRPQGLARKIRRKLGDYGQLWAAKFPPKPRGMWRRTYARHCAALDRIERKQLTPRRSNVR
jgi:hypothetical protein